MLDLVFPMSETLNVIKSKFLNLWKFLTKSCAPIQWNLIANMDKERPLYVWKMVPPQENILGNQVLRRSYLYEVDVGPVWFSLVS